ncbi:MAG: hypothetical protein BHW12_03610 [Coprobacillus sp. 28_7]|nr:MAG: hypothetical protein BHW12_03610 [Coprobacillus sp. 28_7]
MLYDIAFTNKASQAQIAYEIPFFIQNDNINNNFFENFETRLKEASEIESDLLSIKFNLTLKNFEKQIDYVQKSIDIINEKACKPLILRGMNNEKLDIKLLNFLAKNIQKASIIAFAQEANYREIIPTIINTNHKIVLRTPIDINLAKELNILTLDMGLPKDRILIDTDTGGLGYGLDYGYSMMEKVKIEALKGDKMLDFPIISFIGEEVFKAKELKSDSFDNNWGELNKRIDLWEITAATSIIAANANIVVVWNKNTVKTLNEVIKN